MAGHAQLKFVMTECSKAQIRLTGLIYDNQKDKKPMIMIKEPQVHVKEGWLASCKLAIYTATIWFALALYEPRHDKTNKISVRTAKSQVTLCIRPVWSESSLCAQWVAKDPRFLHTDSEDSDQTVLPRPIWVFARRTLILLVLSWRGSFIIYLPRYKMNNLSSEVCGQLRLKPACCSATKAS